MGKTVIVGGGTAGLAAAYTLQRAGADYLVLEERDFSGGRLYSSEREGFTLDLGAQFFFSRYHTTYDLAGKLGIMDELVKFRPLMGLLRDDNVNVISMNMLQNLEHPVRSFRARRLLSMRGSRMAMKLGVKMAMLGNKLDFNDPLKAIELENVSFAEYARRNFGDELLEYVMQPIASTLSLGDPEDISAGYGMALAWYMAPGLATFQKGIGYIAKRMAEAAPNIKLNTSVTRIVLEGKKVKGVEIVENGTSEFIGADSVICATLAPEAAGLMPDLPAEMLALLNDVQYSACTHVLFGLPRRPLGDIYAIATPRREGLCLAGFTDSAMKAPSYAPDGGGIMSAFTYGKYAREMLTMPDEAVQDRVTRDIQSVVPQFPDEPLFCEIFRWPQAVCLSSPGQVTAIQKLKEALADFDGLQMAGEYMGFGSVEAALTYGVQAAERVLAGG